MAAIKTACFSWLGMGIEAVGAEGTAFPCEGVRCGEGGKWTGRGRVGPASLPMESANKKPAN